MGEGGAEENGTPVAETTLSPLEEKIVRQMEYYFGDINLPRDKFLQEQVAGAEGGWVPMETMLKFNRLRSICEDADAILAAVGKAPSGLLEAETEKKAVRRTTPLPENSLEYWNAVKARTVYVKGFPQDAKLDEIEDFFRPHGSLQHVLMRRVKNEDRLFKGSVFATFKTADECKTFLANSPAKFKDTDEAELVKKMQLEYQKGKIEERKEHKAKMRLEKNAGSGGAEEAKKDFTKGLIIHIHGLKEAAEARREDIKAALEVGGAKVGYIWFEMGQDKADVKMDGEEGAAQKALKDAVGEEEGAQLKVKDTPVHAEVLSGDREAEVMNRPRGGKHRDGRGFQGGRGGSGGGRGRGGGRGGRGGRGGGRGGGRHDRNAKRHAKDSDANEPEAKRQVFEDEGDEKPPKAAAKEEAPPKEEVKTE